MTRQQARLGIRLAVLAAMIGMLGADAETGQGAPPGQTAHGLPAEGRLEAFRGAAEFALQPLFSGGRFPNVVVATDGTVLAFWGGVKLRRSEDGGQSWSPDITVGEGFMSGGVTVDENRGDVLAFLFNLSWLQHGEQTGDGELPPWL